MSETTHVGCYDSEFNARNFVWGNFFPSPARDDFDDFQPVARVEPAPGKFRRRDRLAVVLHDDAARQQVLRDQKFLNRARQLRLDWLAVGGDF